jgi:Flp pilus assembly protein TadB
MISNSGIGFGLAWYVFVSLAVVVLVVVLAVVLIRLALAARQTLLMTTTLQEARLELVREQTARLQADGPGAPDAGPVDPIA